MRKLQYLFMTLSVLFLATPAFAQATGDSQASVGHGLIAIAAGWAWASPPGFAVSVRAAPLLRQLRRWLATLEHVPASCCCLPSASRLWSHSPCSRWSSFSVKVQY